MVGAVDRLPVIAGKDLIRVVFAGQFCRRHAFADFHALHGIDRHCCCGQVSVQFAVDRRAQPGGHARGCDLHHRAYGIARFAQAVQIGGPHFRSLGIGNPERVLVDLVPVESRAVDLVLAHLHHVAGDPQSRHHRCKSRARQATCGHPRGGFAGGGPTATAIVADAIFLPVGDVGMSGAEFLGDFGIILGPLIGVFDHQLD